MSGAALCPEGHVIAAGSIDGAAGGAPAIAGSALVRSLLEAAHQVIWHYDERPVRPAVLLWAP